MASLKFHFLPSRMTCCQATTEPLQKLAGKTQERNSLLWGSWFRRVPLSHGGEGSWGQLSLQYGDCMVEVIPAEVEQKIASQQEPRAGHKHQGLPITIYFCQQSQIPTSSFQNLPKLCRELGTECLKHESVGTFQMQTITLPL